MSRAVTLAVVAPLLLWLILLARVAITASVPPQTIDRLLSKACDSDPAQTILVVSDGHSGNLECADARELATKHRIKRAKMGILSTRAVNLFIFRTDVHCTYSLAPGASQADVRCKTYTDAL